MISSFISFQELFSPQYLIEYGGLTLILIIVFAETGLFFGFFLPGDSLLFTAGLLCATGVLDTSIYTLISTICLAGIAGYFSGYLFGKKLGNNLYNKPDSLFFKKRYLYLTQDYYAKHGGYTLIIGRFLPVVRTFSPILAGVINMSFKRFVFFNISGCILWVCSMTGLGYWLGISFPGLQEYLEYIVLGLIIVTFIPVVRVFFKKKVDQTIIAETNKIL